MAAGGYLKAADLPQVIPVFPLDGVLLLPHGTLPLNIFEPRYLNMIDDAMAGDRIIGMIQTVGDDDPDRPQIARIGCAGRITSYAETPDGRYLITLTGVCRFAVAGELPVQTPYRQVRADFGRFGQDLAGDEPEADHDRDGLLEALRDYLERRGLAVDWRMAQEAPIEALVNSLSMALPFGPSAKQALLEAPHLAARRVALVTLLRIEGMTGDDDAPPQMQ
jgi:Lon protease-like protein